MPLLIALKLFASFIFDGLTPSGSRKIREQLRVEDSRVIHQDIDSTP
jgi:hypothetical protein